MAEAGGFQLRTFALIDRMQPQYAALMGTVMSGDIPVGGMAQLFLEVAPGNAIYRVADVALKAADVRPGVQVVERVFGVLELHGRSPEDVRAAASAVLEELRLSESDRIKPAVISSQIITNVDPYQAQLINQQRRGALLVPGQSLLVMEIAPAGYATLAANECEKAAEISMVSVNSIGASGRVMVAGSTSQVQGARDAVLQVFASISGRDAPAGPASS
jgi:ethanolamine utilization microcompartment shell protein EutS